MKQIENDCVDCETCIHCGKDQSTHFYCDGCGDEFYQEDLYKYEDEDLCSDCLISKAGDFKKAFEYGENNKVEITIELNGLLADVYNEEDINDLLIQDFLKCNDRSKDDFSQSYLKKESYDFISWLDENNEIEDV